ncbi:MAG: hypothetical protein ACI9XO_003480 [Paraglaciecola sp.]|jgi:hypothetical protein
MNSTTNWKSKGNLLTCLGGLFTIFSIFFFDAEAENNAQLIASILGAGLALYGVLLTDKAGKKEQETMDS